MQRHRAEVCQDLVPDTGASAAPTLRERGLARVVGLSALPPLPCPCWPCWLFTLLSLAQVSNLKGWKTSYSWPPSGESALHTPAPLQGLGITDSSGQQAPSWALCSPTCGSYTYSRAAGLLALPHMGLTYSSSLTSLHTGLPLPSWPSTHAHSLSVHTQLPSTPLCSQQAWVPVPANPQPSPDYEASRATQPLTIRVGSTALSLPPEEHTQIICWG